MLFELVAKVMSNAAASHCHLINAQVIYFIAGCLVCVQLTIALIEWNELVNELVVSM